MAGIAGMAGKERHTEVENMLRKIPHRGKTGVKIKAGLRATLGAVWPEVQAGETPPSLRELAVWDTRTPPLPDLEILRKADQPFALAAESRGGLILARDPFGVRPLYYGYTPEGTFSFASEVKALMEVTRDVHEFPPGCLFEPQTGFHAYSKIEAQPGEKLPVEQVAQELRLRLEQAVCRRLDGGMTGSWLSGGLDSSIMVALARPHLRALHTFAGGLPGAPDLAFARQVAEALGCAHHEILLTRKDLLKALPEVIYFLESFDALLVRSTIVNYLVSRQAAEWVDAVYSGEGGDELFAGYAYLEEIPDEQLPNELLDITRRLHNTALQRVDRSASAHGLVAHVPFLDPDVAFYVMRLPAVLKRDPEGSRVEKWILRKALEDLLPEAVLWRKKAKFWEGAGVGEILNQYAERIVSDRDFSAERRLPNGWEISTKEELMYYRIFKEYFGEFEDLSWMGRTKGAPRQ